MLCAACSSAPMGAFDCRTLEASTQSMATMLGEIAKILDTSGTTAQALSNVQTYTQKHKNVINLCSETISRELQDMTKDEVMAYHESSIKDERVRLFLDAQDRFQKQASGDQIEALEDAASSLYIFCD